MKTKFALTIAVIIFIVVGLFSTIGGIPPTPPPPPPPTEAPAPTLEPTAIPPTEYVPPTDQPERHKKVPTPTLTPTPWIVITTTGEACNLTCYEELQLTASGLTNQLLSTLVANP